MDPSSRIRFRHSQHGTVSVMTALTLALTIGVVAMSLDTGHLFMTKREQQSATDFAALAAAANVGSASAAASAAAATNGFGGTATSMVELGTYVADGSLAPSLRFTATQAGTPNAVRVTIQKRQAFLFGTFIAWIVAGTGSNASGDAMVTTRSVAAIRDVASFSLGSGLATLDSGVINGVLGGLTGSSLSLSLMDYQSLAKTNIDLFTFSNALAVRAGLTAGTYASLAGGQVSLGSAVRAIGDATPSAQSAAAIAVIAAAVGNTASTFTLGSLVGYGPYATLSTGSAGPLTATVSALTLVSAVLQAANGTHQVETALAVTAPGIVAASLKLSIGEPPVGSSLIAIGPLSTTLTTAQTRLRLTVQLVGTPPASLLTVPIAITVAPGTAVLTGLQCTGSDITTAVVQLGVTPGIAGAWIGTVSDADLENFTTPLDPPAATLVNLFGLLRITGYAHTQMANTAALTVPFSYADILAATPKTVSTSDYLAPLLGSLFSNLKLTITALGVIPINGSALNLSTLQILANDVTPIDALLASALTALGVSLGNSTVWVSGVQCGQSVLVN